MLCLATAPAHAVEPTVCEDARVRVHGSIAPLWRESIRAACAGLKTMPDLDPAAQVRLDADAAGLHVEVMLADGRQAVRVVTRPEDLEVTFAALLTLPPRPAPPPSSGPGVALPEPPLPVPQVATIGGEIGVALAGRLAGNEPFIALSPSVFVLVRVAAWHFGLAFDVDFYLPPNETVAGFEMQGVGGALLALRRFDLAPGLDLDIGLDFRMIVESQSYGGDGTATTETSHTATDLRLGTLGRLAVGGAWRWFIALGAELSPGRLRQPVRLDPLLEALPTWSVSLGFGALWGD